VTALRVLPGNAVHCTVQFQDALSGDPVAPTAVVLRVLKPDASEALPAVSPDAGVGAYQADVIVPLGDTLNGKWYWRWEGTGAAVGAVEGWFVVIGSAFTP
jgi:hypothetical protein